MSRPCWVHDALPGKPEHICRPCRDELALLSHLYQAIAKERQPLLPTCPLGHPYSGENLYVAIHRRRPSVARHCRACMTLAQQRRRKHQGPGMRARGPRGRFAAWHENTDSLPGRGFAVAPATRSSREDGEKAA